MDGHGDDGEEVAFLPLLAAMEATALAHATSSRFIRCSSPQITSSTGRSFSVARSTGTVVVPAERSPPPPPPAARKGRRDTVAASIAAIVDQ